MGSVDVVQHMKGQHGKGQPRTVQDDTGRRRTASRPPNINQTAAAAAAVSPLSQAAFQLSISLQRLFTRQHRDAGPQPRPSQDV